ncbi:MAG TPA: hypothetical protein VMW24_08390 [Sedimentisphaerales bacterium]|nr:hypothetical protein [Sedimentisphaerales bacterium]
MGEYKGIFENAKGEGVNIDRRTICEVLRCLCDEMVVGLAGKDDELLARMVPLAEEAYGMGIKLVKRLVELKIDDLELPFTYETMPEATRREVERLRAERASLIRKLSHD